MIESKAKQTSPSKPTFHKKVIGSSLDISSEMVGYTPDV